MIGKDDTIFNAIKKGYAYFINNLMGIDYAPYYYPGKKYPVEAQNSAQAIQTIAKYSQYLGIDNKEYLKKVIRISLDSLYDNNGKIYYKRGKYNTNKQLYLRWSQTPFILALVNAKIFLEK